MKKITLIFLFILLLNFPQTAKAESLYYGKIKSEGVLFYRNIEEDGAFELPYSYFVEVLDVENDEFYKVIYKDIEGYVKKEEVSLMSGQPNTPYFNQTVSSYVEFPLYLKPETSSTEIVDCKKAQSFNFYGKIEGEEVKETNTSWFYCSTNIDDEMKYGYIYSGIVEDEIKIPINNETFEIVSEEVFTALTNGEQFSALSVGTKILLIISIAVPSVFIIFFLIKPTKIKQSKQKGVRKVQHGDYFEYEDREL